MPKGAGMPGRAGRCLVTACLILLAGLIMPGRPLAAEHGALPKTDPLLFSFFKSVISTTDGKRCSHVPSCARYAKEAVEKHGLFKGYLLSCDRLLRCGGNDREQLPQVVVGGKRYAWDPVSANDFWWGREEGAEPTQTQPSLPLHFDGWE